MAWLSSAWAHHSKIHGYDLMFLFIPDATEVQWPTSEAQLAMRSGIRSVFKKAASDAGIEITDPVRDMRDYWCSNKKALYFNIDGHWNADGHAFIAERMARKGV